MSEAAPNTLEGISAEQRELIMNYLRQSSLSEITAESRAVTPEEEVLAERLLSLGLEPRDGALDRHYKHGDSNFTPDVALKDAAFASAGFDAGSVRVVRHNVVLNTGLAQQLALKIINLVRAEKSGEEDDAQIQEKDIPGGVIFLGKVVFGANPGEDRYENLTEADTLQIEQFFQGKKA
ncbi:MAG: hypothetical protein RL094_70 [Candidatus Parcubacteria bacterium]